MKWYSYFDIITDYINGNTDFKRIRMFGTKSTIINCLNKYASVNPRYRVEIDNIIDNIDELLKESRKIPKYILNIQMFLDGNISFNQLKDLKSKSKLLEEIKNYLSYYPNDADRINNLLNNIDDYFESIKKTPKYVIEIDKYLNGEITFKQLKIFFNSKSVIIDRLNSYKKLYPNKSEKINNILNNIDELCELSKTIPDYEKIINKCLDNNCDISILSKLGSKRYAIECIDKYIKKHPDKSSELTNIKNILISQKFVDTKFHKYELVITSYINDDIDMSGLKKIGQRAYLLTCLSKYKVKYPSSVEKIDEVIKNIDLLYPKAKVKDMRQQTYANIQGISRPDNTKEIIKDLFLSELSIEEYCSKTGNSIATLRRHANKLTKQRDPRIIKMGYDILNRDSSEFIESLKDEVLLNLTKEDADIFDYLNITRLQSKDFRDIFIKILPRKDVIEILSRVDLYRLDPYTNKCMGAVTPSIEGKTVISGREISIDEKQKVLTYLIDNNYPYCLFNSALRKYASGKLELGRSYTLKKEG